MDVDVEGDVDGLLLQAEEVSGVACVNTFGSTDLAYFQEPRWYLQASRPTVSPCYAEEAAECPLGGRISY